MDAETLSAWYAHVEDTVGYARRCEMFVPEGLIGARVLDVNCRRGKGVFKLAAAVGPAGYVLGTDPSPANIAIAAENAAHAVERYGLAAENFAIVQAYPEALNAVAAPASFDLAYLNSSLNTAYDPAAMLAQVAAALKPGGRMACLTVCADAPAGAAAQAAARAAGDAVGAAPTWEALQAMLEAAGFRVERSSAAPAEELSQALPGYAQVTILAVKEA